MSACRLLIPSPLDAGVDQTPQCRVCFENGIKRLISDLQDLEDVYRKYRWTESKIRFLYYEKLWSARNDANDPLSKEKREKGAADNETLEQILTELEDTALQSSNSFSKGIIQFQESYAYFKNCCSENAFGTCVRNWYEPFVSTLQDLGRWFEHIFEGEREYRSAVSQTAGGRQGLYPEDTVESRREHGEYYPRFERERESKRFQEDRGMMESFLAVRRLLLESSEGLNCCLHCGPLAQETPSSFENP